MCGPIVTCSVLSRLDNNDVQICPMRVVSIALSGKPKVTFPAKSLTDGVAHVGDRARKQLCSENNGKSIL